MTENIPLKHIVIILLLSQFFMIPVSCQTPDSVQIPTPIWSDQTGSRDVLVQCSGDGKYVVSGSDTGILRMYDRAGKTLWTFQREGKMVRSIAISGKGDSVGAVFLNPDAPSFYANGEILLFSRTGNILWNYIDDYTVERIAISDDGSSIYASGTPNLYSFDRNGTLIGKNESDGRTWVLTAARDGSYAIAGGTIKENHIAGSQTFANRIYAFEKDGTIPWNYSTRQEISSIGISPDSTTIINAARYELSSFNRNGTAMWQLNSGPDITSVAVSRDGKYSAAGTQYNLRLFNKTGILLWKYEHAPEIRSAGVSDDGNVVIAGAADGVYVFNRTGTLLRHFPSPKPILHVSMTNDGEFFAAGTADTVYFFNKNGNTTVFVENETPTPESSPVLINTSMPGQSTTQRSPMQPVSGVAAIGFTAATILIVRRKK